MNKKITLLVTLLAMSSLMYSCAEDKEDNQTALTADSSVFADVGKGQIVFNLDSSLTLTDSLDSSLISLETGFADLKVSEIKKLSNSSFSLALNGKCIRDQYNLGLVKLSYKGTKEQKENYTCAFSIVDNLIYQKGARNSTTSTGGVISVSRECTFGLYNGATWLADQITETNLVFQTSDEKKHPLSNLTEKSFRLKEGDNSSLEVSLAQSDSDFSAYSLSIAGATNDLAISQVIAL